MPTVDDKGRIVLPKQVRESLGLSPGTEVEVRTDEGTAIIEPEDDPERILAEMDRLVDAASTDREKVPSGDGLHPIARKHAKRIRDGVKGGEFQHE